MNQETDMTFWVHLEELRKRLIYVLLAFILTTIVCYFFSEKLINILTLPIVRILPDSKKLFFTGLLEVFMTNIKISIYAAILINVPFIMYQIWKFIGPALYDKERKILLPIMVSSCVMFFVGTLFCYHVIFPIGLKYLMTVANQVGTPILTVKETVGFFLLLLLIFGFVFQTPILITGITFFGIVDIKTLADKRKYIILLLLVLAAILTPPDPVTMLLLALPLYLLFEISIQISKIIINLKSKKDKKDKKGKEQ